jgi:voltage-gated sodium channel
MLVAVAVRRASKLLSAYNERHRLGLDTEEDKAKYIDVKAKKVAIKHLKSKEKMRKHVNLHFEDYDSPTKEYLMICTVLDLLVNSTFFNNWILFCIIVAGLLVGIQTYPGFEENKLIMQIDLIVLVSFTAEVVFKVLSEGLAPHYYFIGVEYKWNIFDFFIVLFSLPIFPVGGGQVKLLRLIRLTRLAKVFRKIPQLQMIVMGLVGGLKSIVYIVILMLLTFYLFGIAGIIFFRDNDPFHFKSVEISMLTLLRIATFDAWGDILYINYFGCDVYSAGYYTNDPAEGQSALGALQYCDKPKAQPAVAGVYFLLFCVINSFCILSLFIGAVSMSMAESMVQMKQEKEENGIAYEKTKMGEVAERFQDRSKMDKKMKKKISLMELAFQGQSLELHEEKFEFDLRDPCKSYMWLSKLSRTLASNENFQFFVTIVIVLAGVTVGMNTDRHVAVALESELTFMDFVIQMVFLFECILKFVAEEFEPWKYFNDNWNVFDFVVVVGSFMPTGSGSLVTILRLLRLLRVLKLMKALPQLQVIVSALLKGTSSVFFISVILFMFYYFFGIIGMTFFGENDPVNFGRLHFTLLILFQASTLDAWADYMYISLYGCSAIGYDDYPEKCTSNGAQFALTSFYWIIFVLIGALVLLTLFIGVVSMGMEDAKAEQKEEDIIDAKAIKVALMENLEEKDVTAYREVFDVIDFTNSCRIGKEEMRFGLGIAGLHLEDSEFDETWARVDRDNSSGIDFSEFLEFMFDLRYQLNHEEKTCGTFTFSITFTPNSDPWGESHLLEVDEEDEDDDDEEENHDWFGGKVKLNILSALGLQAKDIGFMDSGKSDPYAEVFVGRKFITKSQIIYKTLDPVWNYSCEFDLALKDSSEFCIKLQDYDQFSGPDFLGQILIDVKNIEPNKEFEDTRKVVTHPKRKIAGKNGKVVQRRQFQGLNASRFEEDMSNDTEVEGFIKDLSLEKRLEHNLQKSIKNIRMTSAKQNGTFVDVGEEIDSLENFEEFIDDDGNHRFTPFQRIRHNLSKSQIISRLSFNLDSFLLEDLDEEHKANIKKSQNPEEGIPQVETIQSSNFPDLLQNNISLGIIPEDNSENFDEEDDQSSNSLDNSDEEENQNNNSIEKNPEVNQNNNLLDNFDDEEDQNNNSLENFDEEENQNNNSVDKLAEEKPNYNTFHKFPEESKTQFSNVPQKPSPIRPPFTQKQVEDINSKTENETQNNAAPNPFFQQFPGYNPNAFNPYNSVGQSYFPNMQMDPMARFQLPIHSQMQYLMQQSGASFFPNMSQQQPIPFPMNNVMDLNQMPNQMTNQFNNQFNNQMNNQMNNQNARDNNSNGDDLNANSNDGSKMKPQSQPQSQFMFPPQSYTNPFNFQNNQWNNMNMSSNSSVSSNSSGLPNGKRKKCTSKVVSI